MSTSQQQPLYPWRLDTNNRYRDAVKVLMDLSTASLVIPVFFLRDVLPVAKDRSLVEVLTCKIYGFWICLIVAIFSGVIFYYASAKWVRLAWGKEAGFFGRPTNDKVVERVLEVSFWATITGFIFGIVLIVLFVVTYRPIP